MRKPALVGLLLGTALLAAGAVDLAPTAGAPPDWPKFEGTSLPVPPVPAQAWASPPTTLPSDAVSAITDLFQKGLPDPRGCAYREIEIVTGDCWGNVEKVKTHGWVLPSAADKPSFAIAWNGLVYPAISVGAAADLHADMATMLKKDEAKYGRWGTMVPREAGAVASDSIDPFKVALLLRLGEGDLAARVWSQWTGALNQPADPPYLTLARRWLWSMYDRALCAHMRGDDRLARADAQALTSLRKAIAAKPVERKSSAGPDTAGAGEVGAYLTFLNAVPDLLADETRRLSEPPTTPVLQMATPPQGPERIAGLIRDLDLASARQHMQPGGVDFGEDPIVQALVKCGDAAVEPLLQCLENDRRLTRSVGFWRDFSPNRTVLGVHEAAYVALANILHTDFFSIHSTGDNLTARGDAGRKEVAAAIRAYWEKNKAVPLEERWYRTLANDKASSTEWKEAAQNLTEDVDAAPQRTSSFGGGWMPTPVPVTRGPEMRGEGLRAKTNPSVSDLLVKRMHDTSAPMDKVPDTNWEAKTALGFALAKWDGKEHLAELRDLTDTLRARMNNRDADSLSWQAQPLLRLYAARIQAGDPKALGEYAAWVATLSPEGMDLQTARLFDIMGQHPDDPAVQQAAQKLFGEKGSPWFPLHKTAGFYLVGLLHSPLFKMAPFRSELRRELEDKSTAGTLKIESDGVAHIEMGTGYIDLGNPRHDIDWPGPGSYPFRGCDYVVGEISTLPGAPKTHLYWSEAKRDAAVTACTAFLQDK